jgi:predicted phage tail component-like protein
MHGFKFNGKHNYTDFGVLMESKTIFPPSKKKTKSSVPFMNGSYDFSTVATGGDVVFNERKIEVVMSLTAWSKEQLLSLYSNVLEWIADTGQQQLIFDDIPECFFLAEVEEAADFEEVASFGKMKVTFVAEPFKQGLNYEGSNIWDTFNFETDVLQDVEFDIVTSGTITLVNVGRVVTPVINVDAAMTAYLNSKEYNLSPGDNSFFGFKLANGSNTIAVTGTGRIKFIFRKESL